MNNIININNQELEIKEYKGQRVVTFKDIDNVHQRVDGTAKRNFNQNKGRFIEGEDYFFVKPRDIGEYEIRTSEINNSGTYLITEMGYLMLVKSLNDKKAWEAQRGLVNSYFRSKELGKNVGLEKIVYALNIQLEMMIDKMNQIETSIYTNVNEKLNQLSEYYRPTHLDKIHLCNYIKKRLGVESSSKEYELVKQRILLVLNADKWQDVPFETLMKSLHIVDECIDIIKATRVTKQVSLFD